jgi:hypothetical protein
MGNKFEGYLMGRSSLNSNLCFMYLNWLLGNGSGANFEEYKEAAAKMAEKVGEKASILKDKALDWFSSFK